MGKTEISLEIAKQYNLPILNCDSIQVYRNLDIGSSKPSVGQRLSHPHYLFDYVEPPARLTVADYVRDVHSCITKEKLHRVLFVGGSGFYIQALEKGLYPIPDTPGEIKEQVAQWAEREGFDSLYLWLEKKDPQWIKKVSRKDHYRLRRAVEIMKSQGQTITQLKEQMKARGENPLFRHCSLKLGLRLDKAELKKRIEIRTREMLEQGLIQEVDFLIESGLSQWSPLQSVGYREVKEFLEERQRTQAHGFSEKKMPGRCFQRGKSISDVKGLLGQNIQVEETLSAEGVRDGSEKAGEFPEELKSEIVKNTMKLVKKQMTWFKRDREIVWFGPDEKKQLMDCVGKWMEKQN